TDCRADGLLGHQAAIRPQAAMHLYRFIGNGECRRSNHSVDEIVSVLTMRADEFRIGSRIFLQFFELLIDEVFFTSGIELCSRHYHAHRRTSQTTLMNAIFQKPSALVVLK